MSDYLGQDQVSGMTCVKWNCSLLLMLSSMVEIKPIHEVRDIRKATGDNCSMTRSRVYTASPEEQLPYSNRGLKSGASIEHEELWGLDSGCWSTKVGVP